jgi:hypothetical protein
LFIVYCLLFIVYCYLENNNKISKTFVEQYEINIIKNDIKISKITNDILLNQNYFDKMNDSFNEIELLNNNTFNELVSIDEFSIGTNRTTKKGWSKSGKECIINLPYLKQNKIKDIHC